MEMACSVSLSIQYAYWRPVNAYRHIQNAMNNTSVKKQVRNGISIMNSTVVNIVNQLPSGEYFEGVELKTKK